MKKDHITYEEFIKMEAEKRGQELRKYKYNGMTCYTIGKPNIKRLAKAIIELTEK